MSRRSNRVWVGALLLGGVLAGQAHAGDSGVRALGDRVEQIQSDAATLESRYAENIYRDASRTFAVRLFEGQNLHLLGDHEAAALVLVDLVEDEQMRQHPGQDDARFLLAESLFMSGQFGLSLPHYEGFVRASHPSYGLPSAQRLLEIALRRGRFDGLEALLLQLEGQRRGGPETGALRYLRGRTLYLQGRFPEAHEALRSVDRDSAFGERSDYFASVVLARMGRLDEAMEGFSRQAERLDSAVGGEDRRLRNLAVLGVARIHYERRDFDAAANTYARVDRDGPEFERALYETSWTLIQEGRYRRAGSFLELLALIADDARAIPEALLLKGETELRLEQYDGAVETFERIQRAYAPIEDEVAAAIEAVSAMARSAGQAERPEVPHLEELLSPRALAWLGRDQRDLAMLQDIEGMERDIGFQRQLVAQLYAAIDRERQIDAFPNLKAGWNRALAHRMDLVAIESALLDAEREAVWDRMLDHERDHYRALRVERSALEQDYARIPQTSQALDRRVELEQSALHEREVALFRRLLEMENQLARFDALEGLLTDQAERGELGAEALEAARADLAAERAASGVSRSAAQDLRRELAQLRASLVPASSVTPEERGVIGAYEHALAVEREYLRRFRGRVTTDTADASLPPELRRFVELEAEQRSLLEEAAQAIQMAEAIESTLERLVGTGELPESTERRARGELMRVRAELETLKRAVQEELGAQLAASRGDATRARSIEDDELDRLVDSAVFGLVLRERGPLAAADVEQRRALLREVDQIRGRTAVASGSLAAFFARAQAVIDEEGERLRQRVRVAEEELNRLDGRFAVVDREGREAAARQALIALQTLHGRFEEVNLRAGLGLIDVAWRQQERVAAHRENLLRERNQALRLLSTDFAEILED